MTHKNKITTFSYFLKRLRDSGFIAIKVFKDYAIIDPRRWTIMVDPEGASLLITCYENKDFQGDIVFEFNDGGNKFPKNYNLKTKSMEIIVTTLIERGISQKEDGCSFEKKS
jgi:hypothetical protein